MAQTAERASSTRGMRDEEMSFASYSVPVPILGASGRNFLSGTNLRVFPDLTSVNAIHRMKSRKTPIATTKTQALARALSAVSHGYTRMCTGTVPSDRLVRLVAKFDTRYGIAATKGQRVINRRAGRANTIFAAYSPPAEYRASNERLPWMLLATPGNGVEAETWLDTRDRPQWLGYELSRHNDAGPVRWTWRRPKTEMTQLYAELADHLARQRFDEVSKALQCIARQPGFHGVRGQSRDLAAYAAQRGYTGPLPHLFYAARISHGVPLIVTGAPSG